MVARLPAQAFHQENQEVGSGAWQVAWGEGGHREVARQTWQPLQLLRCPVLACQGNQEEGDQSEGEEEGGMEDHLDLMLELI